MTSTLIIGGHGKVGLLAAPKLVDKGFEVSSLIRNPDQKADIEALGATPVVEDVTALTPQQWDELLAAYDVVVWTAGNGGRAGEDVTYAVDRDAALAVIDSLERLRDSADSTAPRYLNVSYAGSRERVLPEDDSMYAYTEAKKTVDNRLVATTGLDYAILGPGALTEEPSTGFAEVGDAEYHTSRELVADVITELAGRDSLPDNRVVDFLDGDRPVSEI